MRLAKAGLLAGGLAAATLLGGRAMTAGAGVPTDEVKHGDSVYELLEVLAEGLISPADALGKAAAKAEGLPAVEMELTVVRVKDRRTAAWEVVFLKEKSLLEVHVDARTGDVLAAADDPDEKEAAGFRALLAKGTVDLAGALGALQAGGPGLLMDLELDDEGDAAVWEANLVRSGRSLEILLSTTTGKVVPDDGEDDDGDADDDDDDDDDDGDDD